MPNSNTLKVYLIMFAIALSAAMAAFSKINDWGNITTNVFVVSIIIGFTIILFLISPKQQTKATEE
jgi:RsiW-degrading membrane proteinase PrsW (M82 family)